MDSVSGFEFTREIGVFDLVGVPLFHGWLVDPQDTCYESVKDFSYNQLVEMIINNSSAQDTESQQRGMMVGWLQGVVGLEDLYGTHPSSYYYAYHCIHVLSRVTAEQYSGCGYKVLLVWKMCNGVCPPT